MSLTIDNNLFKKYQKLSDYAKKINPDSEIKLTSDTIAIQFSNTFDELFFNYITKIGLKIASVSNFGKTVIFLKDDKVEQIIEFNDHQNLDDTKCPILCHIFNEGEAECYLDIGHKGKCAVVLNKFTDTKIISKFSLKIFFKKILMVKNN